jgi:plastocyanin
MKAGSRSGRWIVLLLLGALAAVPTAARGADGQVTIKSQRFNPPVVTIAPGEAVVWTDEEGGHSVTFDDGFDQPDGCISLGGAVNCSNEGEQFQRSFPDLGDFPYYCKVHSSVNNAGKRVGMTGTVSVKTTGPSDTTTTAPAAVTTEPPTTVTTAATTTTTRKLATSSTLASTTTSTAPAESTTTLTPNEAPAFDPGDDGDGDGEAGASTGGGGGDSGSGTVALIVAVLLAVAGGGGLLLWRLRPRGPAL